MYLLQITGKFLNRFSSKPFQGTIKDRKKTVNIQCGFPKSKSCLINLIAFYNGMTDSVNDGRTLDSFILTLSRLLTVCCRIHLAS